MTKENQMPAEEWMKDMVVAELQRVWPDGILLTELQESTGMGTSDLRATLGALGDEGLVSRKDEDGKVYLVRDEEAATDETQRPAVETAPANAATDSEPEDAPDEEPVTGGEHEHADLPREMYEGRMAIELRFSPPTGPFDGEPPEPDEVARQVMLALRDRARDAVESTFPSAEVDVSLVSLDALNPRAVSLD
jgi:hypothetical protein